MRCTSHPDEDATVQCVVCKKPLCDLCAVPQRDGTFTCDGCAMLTTLQAMATRVEEKRSTKEIKRQLEEAKRKGRVYRRTLILIAVAMVIAIVELVYYFRISKPEAEEFIPARDPAAMTMIINQAIQDYSEDHGGILPYRLEDLLGRYLPPERMGARDLENYSYTKSSANSYELRAKKMGAHPIPDFVVTEEGLELAK